MSGANAGRLVRRHEEAWRRLRDAAGALGEARLEDTTAAGWTAKEMLGHIAFWDEAIVGYVMLAFRSQPLPAGWSFGSGYQPEEPWPRAEVHNAREAGWARGQPATAVLERCEAAHASASALLATVTDEECEANQRYFDSLGAHYEEHLPELRALLDGREGPGG